ncbi:MAG: hypothetical protein OXP07_16580 [Defluviicoccus sp.]|nr:hypothetical protein [Defluviicoccus sp.]
MKHRLTRNQVAWRIAQDIPDGAVVNLGIGQPVLVANFVPAELANWSTGAAGAVPGVGGAMDLAIGAKAVYAMTDHVTRRGEPKIVERATYPLTGRAAVDRIYTDLAVIEVTAQGLAVREIVPGLDLAGLQALTGAPLAAASGLRPLEAPAL